MQGTRKLLQICKDKEAKLKEEIVTLRVKLAELEQFEEGMSLKQYQVKGEEVEKLEVEFASLRKQWNMEKSTMALDNFLEIQRSPLDKSSLEFQKCKYSLHVGKNTKEEPKKPVANNTKIKNEIKRNKK